MTIRILDPNDPIWDKPDVLKFVRENFQVTDINDHNADSYYILNPLPSHALNNAGGLTLIIKQKHLARTVFSHYREADAVISKIKEALNHE